MGRLRRGGDAPRVVGFDFTALRTVAPRPAVAPPPSWVTREAAAEELRPARGRSRAAAPRERVARASGTATTTRSSNDGASQRAAVGGES